MQQQQFSPPQPIARAASGLVLPHAGQAAGKSARGLWRKTLPFQSREGSSPLKTIFSLSTAAAAAGALMGHEHTRELYSARGHYV